MFPPLPWGGRWLRPQPFSLFPVSVSEFLCILYLSPVCLSIYSVSVCQCEASIVPCLELYRYCTVALYCYYFVNVLCSGVDCLYPLYPRCCKIAQLVPLCEFSVTLRVLSCASMARLGRKCCSG